MITVRRLGFFSGRVLLIPCLFLLLATPYAAGDELSIRAGSGTGPTHYLGYGQCPRVADPKLEGGGVPISFTLLQDNKDLEYDVSVSITSGNLLVRRLTRVSLPGSRKPVELWWDGKDQAGRFVSPGEYTVRISADRLGTVYRLCYLVNIVRLGITEIEALPYNNGDGLLNQVMVRDRHADGSAGRSG